MDPCRPLLVPVAWAVVALLAVGAPPDGTGPGARSADPPGRAAAAPVGATPAVPAPAPAAVRAGVASPAVDPDPDDDTTGSSVVVDVTGEHAEMVPEEPPPPGPAEVVDGEWSGPLVVDA